MKKILFLHGFFATGSCPMANAMREAFEGCAVVLTPDLPLHPKEALKEIRSIIDKEHPDLLVGNSCGAFLAQMLSPVVGIPALLEIQKYKAEIEDLKKKLTAKNERLDNSRDEILRKANEEAVQILKEAKDLADETIRNFNKYGQGQAPMSKMEKERSRVRDKMSASEKALSMKKKETVNHKIPKKLRIGDSVRVLSMNLKGTVHTLPNAKGDLYVQMGILRSLVNIKDLVLIDEDASPAAKKYGGTSSGKIKMSKAASVSTEINLIGMTVDEAIAHLDKYLDDAYVAHLPSVRIVHGKGTGALRNAVQAHLKNQRYVKSYRMGEPSEGGAGVTIAAFDV